MYLYYICKNIIMEIWKDIPGYSNDYQISNLGNIKNKEGLILKQKINKYRGDYKLVILWKYSNKMLSVHRLVAKTFIPNPLNKPEVNHIDGDKTNNRIENLEWVTHQENIQHAYKNGLAGGKTYKSKLTDENVIEIKKLLNKGVLHKIIATKFNISPATVSMIKLGKRKKYVI